MYKVYSLLYRTKFLHLWSSLNGFEKLSIKNFFSRKVSSNFVSDTISISILLPANVTSDSNLFLTEFKLRWPMIILCGFWFFSCLSSQMPLVLLSTIGSEKELSNFPETLCSTSSDWLLDERGSFKCSKGLWNFRIDSWNLKQVYLYLLGLLISKYYSHQIMSDNLNQINNSRKLRIHESWHNSQKLRRVVAIYKTN